MYTFVLGLFDIDFSESFFKLICTFSPLFGMVKNDKFNCGVIRVFFCFVMFFAYF